MFSDFLLGSQSILILQIPADILYIHIYIRYVVDTVLLCECTDLLHSFRVHGVAAPGHLGSTGWEPQTVSGHLGHATVLCQGTGHREGTEGFKLLKCCDGGCCSSCAARCLGSLCVHIS